MATYHCSVKAGSKGGAGSHSEYIERDGEYEGYRGREDLEAKHSGNMPAWAEHDASLFWHAADEYERANGSTYREHELALPRELTPDQRAELVREWVQQELGDRHAYTWAIHTPQAVIDGGDQPHVHLMYSERLVDEIERDPAQYFRRYNAKNPAQGGAKKASQPMTPAERKAALVALRQRWADLTNKHLAKHGHKARVDHRSLADQGIARTPERHLGPALAHATPQHIEAIRSYRQANRQLAAELPDLAAELRTQLTKAAQAVRDGINAYRQKFNGWKAEKAAKLRQQAMDKAVKTPAPEPVRPSPPPEPTRTESPRSKPPAQPAPPPRRTGGEPER